MPASVNVELWHPCLTSLISCPTSHALLTRSFSLLIPTLAVMRVTCRAAIQHHGVLAHVAILLVPHIDAVVVAAQVGVHAAVHAAIHQNGAAIVVQQLVQVLLAPTHASQSWTSNYGGKQMAVPCCMLHIVAMPAM